MKTGIVAGEKTVIWNSLQCYITPISRRIILLKEGFLPGVQIPCKLWFPCCWQRFLFNALYQV